MRFPLFRRMASRHTRRVRFLLCKLHIRPEAFISHDTFFTARIPGVLLTMKTAFLHDLAIGPKVDTSSVITSSMSHRDPAQFCRSPVSEPILQMRNSLSGSGHRYWHTPVPQMQNAALPDRLPSHIPVCENFVRSDNQSPALPVSPHHQVSDRTTLQSLHPIS